MSVEQHDNAQKFHTTRGAMRIWTPGQGLVLAKLSGYGEGEFAQPIVHAFSRIAGSFQIFFDVGQLEGYDSPLRVQITAGLLARLQSMKSLHVLTQSKLVSMGVSVSNMVLGGRVTSHTTTPSFRAAVDAAAREARLQHFSSAVLDGR